MPIIVEPMGKIVEPLGKIALFIFNTIHFFRIQNKGINQEEEENHFSPTIKIAHAECIVKHNKYTIFDMPFNYLNFI